MWKAARRIALAVAAAAGVAGCGVVYQTSAVRPEAPGVRVLPLTAESVLAANRSPYQPRSLPTVLRAVTRAGTLDPADGGPLPAPRGPLSQPVRPGPPALIPPPDAPVGPYVIGVGDVLLLATRGRGSDVDQLSDLLAAQNARQGYTVQDDGAIAIPDVGRVRVAGTTIEEAEAALFQALVAAQLDPAFSLEVAEFNSQRVAVGGAVGRAGVVSIGLSGLTLGEAITRAGGVTAPEPEFTVIRIYRDGALYQVPLEAFLAQPALQRLRLAADDGLYVGQDYDLQRARDYFEQQLRLRAFQSEQRRSALDRLRQAVELRRTELEEARRGFETAERLGAVDRDHVYLAGEVAQQGRFQLPFERQATLADVLFDGGGYDVTTANPGQIYVLRASSDPRELGAVTAWHLDARQATNLTVATRMEMRPDDVVFVSEQPVTRWNRALQQITPSLVLRGVAP